jgi:hypothetical protein
MWLSAERRVRAGELEHDAARRIEQPAPAGYHDMHQLRLDFLDFCNCHAFI